MLNIQFAKVSKVEQFYKTKKITIVPDGITNEFKQFIPGQYVILNIDIDNHIEQRKHSISSNPIDGTKEYSFFIPRKEDGYTSKHINDKWKVGTKISLSYPMGDLVINNNDVRNVVAVGKGNDVTPFLSIAYAIAEGLIDANLTILHEVDYEEELIFKPELLKILAKTDKVKLINLIKVGPVTIWKRGIIDAKEISLVTNDKPFMLLAQGSKEFYKYIDKIASKMRPVTYKKDIDK